MTRLLLATLAVLLIATVSQAIEPPKAMPGNPEPAKPAAAAVMPNMVTDAPFNANGCCDASGCCERPGVLARINARWSGHRCAHIEPNPCTNNFPSYGSYTPIITSYQSRCCLKSDDRCRGFGVGRFFNRCKTEKNECKDSMYLRLRARLGLRRCKNDAAWKCMPTPYHSPVRYYFQPDGEPVCGGSGGCADGCTTINPGGRIPRMGAAACSERVTALGYLRGMLKGGGCGDGIGCRDGQCRRKEECYGIPGSHFNNDIRFARDEKMKFAPIVASQGIDYRGGWHFDLQRIKAEENPVISAGYKTPAK